MKTNIIKATAESAEGTLFLGDDWFDPLEAGVRTRIRGFIEELLETELDAALGRDRYERPRLAETCGGGRAVKRAGYRHGHRERQLMGTFGPATVRVPRARLETSELIIVPLAMRERMNDSACPSVRNTAGSERPLRSRMMTTALRLPV